MIKRLTLLFTTFLAAFSLLAMPLVAGASDPCSTPDPQDPLTCVCSQQGAANTATCQSRTGNHDPVTGANGIILKVANFVAIITGVAAVIMVIIGGLQYVLSQGDSTKIQNAKNTILFAIIGVVIVALADVIVTFVVNKL